MVCSSNSARSLWDLLGSANWFMTHWRSGPQTPSSSYNSTSYRPPKGWPSRVQVRHFNIGLYWGWLTLEPASCGHSWYCSFWLYMRRFQLFWPQSFCLMKSLLYAKHCGSVGTFTHSSWLSELFIQTQLLIFTNLCSLISLSHTGLNTSLLTCSKTLQGLWPDTPLWQLQGECVCSVWLCTKQSSVDTICLLEAQPQR